MAPSRESVDQGQAPYLQVREVTRKYGPVTALDGVSLDVPRGAFVCFLGPSGCGKTTLLRVIAGLERQDAGRVIQNGVDVSDLPPGRRDFGIVFQSYALFPNLTARANVAYGLEARRLPRAEVRQRVAELLTLVGLEEAAERYPAQLSGGQQQRVALARALALSPGLLLLDEPLSALDARVRHSLRAELLALHRRVGVTTIMVTHDQEEALTMADILVVMRDGAIAQVGRPREVYEAPASPFVADFVGSMNFLAGAAGERPGEVRCGSVLLTLARSPAAAAGAAITIGVRPEDVHVLAEGDGGSGQLAAQVDAIEYRGAQLRVRLVASELATGAPPPVLFADMSGARARFLDLAPGRSYRVQLPPEALHGYAQPAPGRAAAA
jgi:iron(III) transport system ATP-binding protein